MAFLSLSSSEQEEADARCLICILRDATPFAAPTSGGFIFFPPFPFPSEPIAVICYSWRELVTLFAVSQGYF